jgi:hypothetical protein
MLRTVEGEVLMPVEDLHRRFDAAYDCVETLHGIIEQHRADGIDCSKLLAALRKAEAEKKVMLAELRKARCLKVVSAA